MSSPPVDLETYAVLSFLETLRAAFPTTTINGIGMRPKTDDEEWLDFYPMGDVRRRSRAVIWDGRLLFQVSCNSKIQEGRADRDTMAPYRLASRVRVALEHKDVAIRTIGVAPETILGAMSVHEARQRYLARRNITFQGEGNFSVEQGSAHTVVVTFQATLIASA